MPFSTSTIEATDALDPSVDPTAPHPTSDPAIEVEVDDPRWIHLVDKVTQTAVVLVVVKLLAAWAIAYLRGVGIENRMMWNIVPIAGLQTSGAEFRTIAAHSTAVTALFAAGWVLVHFLRRRRFHPARTWGAAAALPMAALLTGFEWWRRFDADHLVPTDWLVRILLFLAVATVLFLGFIEFPVSQDDEPLDELTEAERLERNEQRRRAAAEARRRERIERYITGPRSGTQ